MTEPVRPEFKRMSEESLAGFAGDVALPVDPGGNLGAPTRRLDGLAGGVISRFVSGSEFSEMETGACHVISPPPGLSAAAVIVCKLASRSEILEARRAGASIAKAAVRSRELLIVSGTHLHAEEMAFGAVLRRYDFSHWKTAAEKPEGAISVMTRAPERDERKYQALAALADGLYFTRDLVNEPANILTTDEFADRLRGLASLGVDVNILDEDAMRERGMLALLGVGQGSRSPSYLVTMHWRGGGGGPQLALVGKGVVFDTGGISIKPAANMEEMTTDMGGAGAVAGIMKAIATRGANANVVGIVGLVENMPGGNAQRPGDIVKSLKGDTIEVINTDAEGRLVLADALWYAQEDCSPDGIIDFATLTGAIIVALGHEHAGAFSNDDDFCNAFLEAANREGEKAWRMPLGKAYDKQLKSRKADMKNVGGRDASAITAAQFLARFVRKNTPWIHLDVAGVANLKSESDLSPRGATGWGLLAVDRLIRDRFETPG